MPIRIGKASLYLFLAYWIVTLLAILLTILFAILFNPPSPEEWGVTLLSNRFEVLNRIFILALGLVVCTRLKTTTSIPE
jgi:hypothetical protein